MIEVILYVQLCFAAIDECHAFEPVSWATDASHLQQAFDDCAEREREYMLLPGYKESDCYYVSPEKE